MNDTYQIRKHPTERFLFKPIWWKTRTIGIDLSGWVPLCDARRIIESHKSSTIKIVEIE